MVSNKVVLCYDVVEVQEDKTAVRSVVMFLIADFKHRAVCTFNYDELCAAKDQSEIDQLVEIFVPDIYVERAGPVINIYLGVDPAHRNHLQYDGKEMRVADSLGDMILRRLAYSPVNSRLEDTVAEHDDDLAELITRVKNLEKVVYSKH